MNNEIVFIITQTGRFANGGIASVVEIVRGLTGWNVTVLAPSTGPADAALLEAGATLEVLETRFTNRLISLSIANLWVFREVRRLRARVVHCNDIHAADFGAFGAKLAGAKVIFNIRDTLGHSQRVKPKWRLVRSAVDAIIVLSNEMADWCRQTIRPLSFLGTHVKTHAIYSAVDLAKNQPVSSVERECIRARLGIGPDELAVSYVANVCDKKNQLGFLKGCAAEVLARSDSIRLHFVGDFLVEEDPHAKECLEWVAEAGLEERVVFHGYTADVQAWYVASDLLVLASRREGLARCMIEGLACGTPMVSFDVCSAREVLEDGHCGVVVSQGDYAALTDALTNLASDTDRRLEMGRNGRKVAARCFDPVKSVSRYNEIYHDLAGPSK